MTVCDFRSLPRATTKYILSEVPAKAFFIESQRLRGEKGRNELWFPTKCRAFACKPEEQVGEKTKKILNNKGGKIRNINNQGILYMVKV